MPRRPNDAAPIPRVTLPSVALSRHHPASVVRERVRSGTWERVARGVYLPSSAVDPDRARAVALARILGIHDRLDTAHWFSHASAALLWGLPVWSVPTRTHVYRPHRSGAANDPAVASHHNVPPPRDLTFAGAFPVTGLERTIVDCASSLTPLQGLVVADAGLRAGADRALIDSVLADQAGRRGVIRAREVIAFADDGAESPGESAARYAVLRDGLPVPTTQIRVATRLGEFWADLGWAQWRLLLEYDGRSKYEGSSSDTFMREKRRHDAVVEAGWRSMRVTKEDLTGTVLSRRILPLLPSSIRAEVCPRRILRP